MKNVKMNLPIDRIPFSLKANTPFEINLTDRFLLNDSCFFIAPDLTKSGFKQGVYEITLKNANEGIISNKFNITMGTEVYFAEFKEVHNSHLNTVEFLFLEIKPTVDIDIFLIFENKIDSERFNALRKRTLGI